nr:hypothetical protein CFP56_30180 [Quercus suber]
MSDCALVIVVPTRAQVTARIAEERMVTDGRSTMGSGRGLDNVVPQEDVVEVLERAAPCPRPDPHAPHHLAQESRPAQASRHDTRRLRAAAQRRRARHHVRRGPGAGRRGVGERGPAREQTGSLGGGRRAARGGGRVASRGGGGPVGDGLGARLWRADAPTRRVRVVAAVDGLDGAGWSTLTAKSTLPRNDDDESLVDHGSPSCYEHHRIFDQDLERLVCSKFSTRTRLASYHLETRVRPDHVAIVGTAWLRSRRPRTRRGLIWHRARHEEGGDLGQRTPQAKGITSP